MKTGEEVKVALVRSNVLSEDAVRLMALVQAPILLLVKEGGDATERAGPPVMKVKLTSLKTRVAEGEERREAEEESVKVWNLVLAAWKVPEVRERMDAVCALFA